MKGPLFLLWFTTFFALKAHSQNLVTNSSFETVTAEPYYGCEIINAAGWLNPSGGPCPTNSDATPDLFSTFSTGQAVLPNSFMGTTNAHTGNRIAGIVTYHEQITNYREYLMTRLTCPLIPGKTYTVSFWTTGGDPVQYVYHTNNLGIHFSINALTQLGYNMIPGLTPQFEETTVVANSVWTFYSYTFVPTQAYEYMAIGNYRNDGNTQKQTFGSNRPYAYYFLDDISVSLTSLAFTLGNDASYCGPFTHTLSTDNANTVWSTGATASEITVTSPGTYWASITTGCNVSTDTIVITQGSAPAGFNLGNDSNYCSSFSRILSTGNPNTIWSTGVTAPQIIVNAPGIYWATIIDACGITYADTIRLTQNTEVTPINLGADTTYCGDFTRVLSTGQASTLWSNGITAPQITVSNAGTYWAMVSNTCGSVSDTITFTQNPAPDVNLGNDTALCLGQSIVLDAQNGGSTYQWQDGSGAQTYTVTTGGTYIVTATNFAGCTNVDTLLALYYTTVPVVNLGNDTAFCGNFSYTLYSGYPLGTFWSNGEAAPQTVISQPGTYWATVNNGCGIESDTISLFQNPVPVVNIGNDTVICPGEWLLLDALNNGASYHWQDNTSNQTYQVSVPGNYAVTVTNAFNCATADTIEIARLSIPTVGLGPDTFVCGNQFDLFLHVPNVQYLWQNGTTDSVFSVTTSGTYTVTVTNTCGSASDAVQVDIHADECALLIPTAFSPNGDGANDIFRAICRCPVERYDMHVYNRWGELVFETFDTSDGWDGFFNNTPQPLSVYVYYLNYFNYCEQKMKSMKGNVTLVR